jgi:glycosyltransferase involved in cell wall biosynthesis
MKIAHVITTISQGGAENQLLVLAREQVEMGNVVSVMPLKGALDLDKAFEALGVQVNLDLHGLSFFHQVMKFRKQASGLGVDIFHAHLPQAELLLSASRARFVSTRHYGEKFFPGHSALVSRLLALLAAKKAVYIIAISEAVKNWILSSREISTNTSIAVIPYGYESSSERRLEFDGSFDNQRPKHYHHTKFSVFARLSPEKDLPTVIRAFALLTATNPSSSQVMLKIYGEGPQRFELERLCFQLGLNPREIFMGRTSRPLEAMKIADAIIVASRFEGFGMVYLEAMSLGIPILASQIDAAVEVLGTDGAALFYPSGDFQSLSELMIDWRSQLKSDYRLRQLDRLLLFSSKKMASQVSEIYEQAISTRKS